mgnify:FL=1
MAIDGIVFDLDGTLVDSVHDIRANLNLVLEGIRRRPLTTDETKRGIGHGARALVEKALNLTGDAGSADIIDRCTRDFLDLYKRNPVKMTPVFSGVPDVLGRLQEDGFVLGVCTNKPEDTTRAVLDGLGLSGYFQAVTCGDMVPHRKPDGRHVITTLEMMGTRTAVMVGDSEADMAAARDAGIQSIAVTYGYRHCPPEDLDSDLLIERFSDLPDALSRL